MTANTAQPPSSQHPTPFLRISLTTRILAVNVIVLALLAGSLFYLDSYRKQLMTERLSLARSEAETIAAALSETPRNKRASMIVRIGKVQNIQLRIYDSSDRLIADSFVLAPPSFAFVDPASEPWYQHAARMLDSGMNVLLASSPVEEYPNTDNIIWPEVTAARHSRKSIVYQRAAPDQTPVINAAAPIGKHGQVLLTTRNPRDITQNIRDARQVLAIVIVIALATSILLSLFLARTIVRPLRSLVRAAVRVRLGRDREVVVPRLPGRGDEIGLLARAISDMSAALRQRIDAVERFAADVSHELKNPLASLRTALESIERVHDTALRERLIHIAIHDVQRIDRLITEIAEASRIDAELSRTAFETIDLFAMVKALVHERDSRNANSSCLVTVSREGINDMLINGNPARLERAFHNLLDNAVSFSPPDGQIDIEFSINRQRVLIAVSDHGPGIPIHARERVFERFHSLRPESEEFASHSGLGLAIARTIIEAHFGSLTAHDRKDGRPGARMVINLPAIKE